MDNQNLPKLLKFFSDDCKVLVASTRLSSRIIDFGKWIFGIFTCKPASFDLMIFDDDFVLKREVRKALGDEDDFVLKRKVREALDDEDDFILEREVREALGDEDDFMLKGNLKVLSDEEDDFVLKGIVKFPMTCWRFVKQFLPHQH
ncbi:hypothetical protein RhiirC2_800296 [Rhizophagus irregularis]|uniref:Uncharacterized protein n=1 Tax=Rhizophagus irregularis TaxID=588596 RepID=A0A2N1M3U8_9GLOM|nr:hypothetical protein RhiirC2_800296 [Rhizophagus irregularis]